MQWCRVSGHRMASFEPDYRMAGARHVSRLQPYGRTAETNLHEPLVDAPRPSSSGLAAARLGGARAAGARGRRSPALAAARPRHRDGAWRCAPWSCSAVGFATLADRRDRRGRPHRARASCTAGESRDVRALADAVERNPLGLGAGDAQLRLDAVSREGRRLRVRRRRHRRLPLDLRRAQCRRCARRRRPMLRNATDVAPGPIRRRRTAHPCRSAGDRTCSSRAPSATRPASRARTVVVGVDAAYLADQAARTAWLLLAISYALLVIVGWTSWQQVSRLARHAHSRDQHAAALRHRRRVARRASRSTATSCGAGGQRLDLHQANARGAELERRALSTLVELAPDAVLMCADTRIRSANPAAIALAGAKKRDRSDRVADRPVPQVRGRESARADTIGGLRPATMDAARRQRCCTSKSPKIADYMDGGARSAVRRARRHAVGARAKPRSPIAPSTTRSPAS